MHPGVKGQLRVGDVPPLPQGHLGDGMHLVDEVSGGGKVTGEEVNEGPGVQCGR